MTTPTQERRIFAPRPLPITIVLATGETVETDLYHFLDLKPKAAVEVIELETAMVGKTPAEVFQIQRDIVSLLCPGLATDAVIAPGLCRDLIEESHEMRAVPRAAGGEGSPSASAPSSSASSSAAGGSPATS